MVQHQGYFLHHYQALYKNIQSLGLSISYLDDEDIRLACRSVMALALMPKEHVEEAFEVLKENSPAELADFFSYVQQQWFKRVPPEYWVVSDLDWRTNNFAEVNVHHLFWKRIYLSHSSGWHNKSNNWVDKHHPHVWHLFECLKREELSFRQQLGKLNSGIERERKAKNCNTRIQIETLTKRYNQEDIDLIEFLHGLSMVIAKNSTVLVK